MLFLQSISNSNFNRFCFTKGKSGFFNLSLWRVNRWCKHGFHQQHLWQMNFSKVVSTVNRIQHFCKIHGTRRERKMFLNFVFFCKVNSNFDALFFWCFFSPRVIRVLFFVLFFNEYVRQECFSKHSGNVVHLIKNTVSLILATNATLEN